MDIVPASLPTFQSIRPSLYRSRRKRRPCMPRSRANVHFEGEWAQTIDSRRFLLVEDGDDDKVVIFATDDNLKLLTEAECLFVDGTFHTCPEVFYQIFTVHAFRSGQQFPLAYCLLPRRPRSQPHCLENSIYTYSMYSRCRIMQIIVARQDIVIF